MSQELKTEKEKMLAGELYFAGDPELTAERLCAQKLFYRYNHSSPENTKERQEILKQLLGSIGEEVYIIPDFRCDYGYNIHLGNQVFINYQCIALDTMPIYIGNRVFLAPNVQLYSATHPLDAHVRSVQQLEYGKPIYIEDEVWIGGGSIILPGVRIGARSVIGAGSVVTKDIPPDSLAVGNPARVMKKLNQ
jgi:maltose O-acetyltransferase